jgi:hypothetical protein
VSNDYFNHSDGQPITGSRGLSANMRSVFDQIVTGFGLLPSLSTLFTSKQNFLVDSGTANAIVISSPSSSISAIADGMEFRVRVAYACTGGTPTVTIGSLGTFNVTHGDGTQLVANDWTANQIVTFTYCSATATLQYTECSTSALALSVAAGTPYASTPSKVARGGSAGTQANYARGDHTHASSFETERAIRRARLYQFS